MSHREHAVYSHCKSLCQASWDVYIFLNPVLAVSLILNSVIQLYELSLGKALFLPQPSSLFPCTPVLAGFRFPEDCGRERKYRNTSMTDSALGKPTNPS